MAQVEKTVTIKVGETEYVVAEQSELIQRLVKILDQWRQDESDERDALIKTGAALRDLQRELLAAFQAEEAQKAVDAANDAPAAAVDVPAAE